MEKIMSTCLRAPADQSELLAINSVHTIDSLTVKDGKLHLMNKVFLLIERITSTKLSSNEVDTRLNEISSDLVYRITKCEILLSTDDTEANGIDQKASIKLKIDAYRIDQIKIRLLQGLESAESLNKKAKETSSREFAFFLFKEAARLGSNNGITNLGICYQYGWGGEKNSKLALEQFEKSTRECHIEGIFWLGRCYLTGDGVKKNYQKAYIYLKLAVNKGHTKAKVYLAKYLFQFKAFKSAEALYLQAAELDDAHAHLSLGIMYLNGAGESSEKVDKNRSEAKKHLELAFEKGNTRAKILLDKYFSEIQMQQSLLKNESAGAS
jgi:tetratricopeptide (TPR) repeat protein